MRHCQLILFLSLACALLHAKQQETSAIEQRNGYAIEQRDGYTIERVEVGGHNAYLLCPDGAKEVDGKTKIGRCKRNYPAVLALHDHGAWFTIGKEKLTTPIWDVALDSASNMARQDESKRWMEKCFEGQAVADSLAKAGYIVLITDALYWGERSVLWSNCATPDGLPIQHLCNTCATPVQHLCDTATASQGSTQPMSYDQLKALNKQLKNYQDTFYNALLAKDTVWFEAILQDDMASVTYLASLPQVDAKRIYAWGFSMGAYRAWQLAAEDPRVAGCAASHWMTTANAQGGYITSPSSYSMYRPSLYRDSTPPMDYPDIAIKIIPRPFLVQYGTDDNVISKTGAEDACIYLSSMYIYYNYAVHKSLHAAKKGSRAFQSVAYPVRHVFTQQHLADLLQWLQYCSKMKR